MLQYLQPCKRVNWIKCIWSGHFNIQMNNNFLLLAIIQLCHHLHLFSPRWPILFFLHFQTARHFQSFEWPFPSNFDPIIPRKSIATVCANFHKMNMLCILKMHWHLLTTASNCIKWLVTFQNATHNIFTQLCSIMIPLSNALFGRRTIFWSILFRCSAFQISRCRRLLLLLICFAAAAADAAVACYLSDWFVVRHVCKTSTAFQLCVY